MLLNKMSVVLTVNFQLVSGLNCLQIYLLCMAKLLRDITFMVREENGETFMVRSMLVDL